MKKHLLKLSTLTLTLSPLVIAASCSIVKEPFITESQPKSAITITGYNGAAVATINRHKIKDLTLDFSVDSDIENLENGDVIDIKILKVGEPNLQTQPFRIAGLIDAPRYTSIIEDDPNDIVIKLPFGNNYMPSFLPDGNRGYVIDVNNLSKEAILDVGDAISGVVDEIKNSESLAIQNSEEIRIKFDFAPEGVSRPFQTSQIQLFDYIDPSQKYSVSETTKRNIAQRILEDMQFNIFRGSKALADNYSANPSLLKTTINEIIDMSANATNKEFITLAEDWIFSVDNFTINSISSELEIANRQPALTEYIYEVNGGDQTSELPTGLVTGDVIKITLHITEENKNTHAFSGLQINEKFINDTLEITVP